MAHLVLGLGSSHSPQLSIPPNLWAQYAERDQRNPNLRRPDGSLCTYEELLASVDTGLHKELTPEVWQKRHDACQRGLSRLADTLESVAPDIVLVLGDDQNEVLHDDNMPVTLVYWGDTLHNVRRYQNTPSPVLQAAAWAYGPDGDYPVASDFALHLIESLIDQEFDVAHSRHLPDKQGIGHAFSFLYGRLMPNKVLPMVPIMLNTYYPPNQPTPKRCYALGQAIRRAVENWPDDCRVAIVASGGLSHFVIDEELDQQTLTAMQQHDAATLTSIPRARLQAGNSEILNWIAAAGAVEHLDMQVIDYVPCYRSPAGTGCAMGFVQWGA